MRVLDENDNAPIFSQPSIIAYATEGQVGFRNTVQFKITDKDIGNNGAIVVSLVPESPDISIEKKSDFFVLNLTQPILLDEDQICDGDSVQFTLKLIAKGTFFISKILKKLNGKFCILN